MFGSYDIPFEIKKEGLEISAKSEEGRVVYKRILVEGDNVENIILSKDNKILINPIEPVKTPREISSELLIEFSNKIFIEPRSTKKVYVTFPIEIGVFVLGGRSRQVIDFFTRARQKFTLYGDVRNGVICKYWKSDVNMEIPSHDNIKEGIMELFVINPTQKWISIGKAVFSAFGMKIYYNEKMVSMKARIKIMSKEVAETDFIDSPLEKDMKKSVEIFEERKIMLPNAKFLMEGGL